MLFTRYATTFAIAASFVSKVGAIAAPNAQALPWANANPQAFAAANAYADAYAEAIAFAHPDPEAYALAASADDCASIACHASCGLLIIAGQECSVNSENTYQGPYNTSCLCTEGSQFKQYYAPCMDCGWTLWKYYGGYVSSALAACETLSTEPTGTLRCSTTLTDSYSIDTGLQGCSYLGNCPTTTSDGTTAQPTSDVPTSTADDAATTTDATASSTTEAPQPTDNDGQGNGETTEDQTEDPTTTTAADGTTSQGQTTDEPTASNGASADDPDAPAGTHGQTTAPVTRPGSATNYPTTSSAAPTFGYFNDSTSVISDITTTLVTVTSCKEDKCTEVKSTAQVSIATTTINGVVTSYTTYCPITTDDHVKPTEDKTTHDITTKDKDTKTHGVSTKDKTTHGTTATKPESKPSATKGTETKTKADATASVPATQTKAPEASSTAAITTFEGSAARLITGSFFGILPFLFI